jgi:hypothetical protein
MSLPPQLKCWRLAVSFENRSAGLYLYPTGGAIANQE